MAGLGQGFLQGLSVVSGVLNDNRRLKMAEEARKEDLAHRDRMFESQQERYQVLDDRYADDKSYRESRDGILDDRYRAEQDYRRGRDAVADRRADAADARASARDRATIRSSNATAAKSEYDLAALKRKEEEATRFRYLTAAIEAYENNGGDWTPEVDSLAQRGGFDIARLADPETVEAKNKMLEFLSGEGEHSKADLIDAANIFFADEVNSTAGTVTEDGWTIENTRIKNAYPSDDGQFMTFDLEVTKSKDGKTETYTAPATEERRTDDEFVLQVPTEKIVGKVKSWDVASQMLTPDQVANALKARRKAYGLEQKPDWVKLSEGQVAVNPDTGERLEGNPKTGQAGLGALTQSQQLNQGRQLLNGYFNGAYDGFGNFMVDDDNKNNYLQANTRFEELVHAGVDTNRAAEVAALSVVGASGESDARRAATKEAAGMSFGAFGGSKKQEWIDARTQEIMEEGAWAEQEYANLVGNRQAGLGAPQQQPAQPQQPPAQPPAQQPPTQQPSAPPEGWQLMRNPNTGQMIYVSPDRKSYMEAQ